MASRLSDREFLDQPGVAEWSVLDGRACARFRTGTFARGVTLIDAIATLADRGDHHPDIDLRYGHITVQLVTHDVGGLTERDVALARAISAATRGGAGGYSPVSFSRRACRASSVAKVPSPSAGLDE